MRETLINLFKQHEVHELVASAGFCFFHENTKDGLRLFLGQCSHWWPDAGNFYHFEDITFPLAAMTMNSLEVSQIHSFSDNRTGYLEPGDDELEVAYTMLCMIRECPKFGAILLARRELSELSASLPQQPSQPTTKTQRGRL